MSFIPFILASLRLATQTQAAENTHTVGPITVKVEGVCKIDDATLSCWTPKGESSPSIAEKVSAYYKVYDYDLPLKMGVKNRYLVVSETDSRGQNHNQTAQFYFAGAYLNHINGLDVTHARSFDWYHIRLEPTVDRFSVLARMFSPDIDKAKLGAKEGDKINIGPGSIEVWDSRVVAQAEEEKFSYLSMGSPPGKRWVVNFIAHELTSDYQQFLVPLGRKGKISWVTAEGKPSSEATDIRPFFQPAPSESMRSFVTNIDPREIASYQVSAGHTVEVLFRDIAAEPK